MKEWNVFEKSQLSTEEKLKNFPKYVRRQDLSRFIAFYELFKKIIDIKGSIVDCGVHLGFSLFTFAKLSSNLEPFAIHRKIIGFDTFEGFPNVSEKDELKDNYADFKPSIDIYQELVDCIKAYDINRFLNQYPKIELIKGDAINTIPKYLEKNKHLTISLLFLDFDLYEPTKIALELLAPLVVKGGIIAFDELNNPFWKGETVAALEYFKTFNKLKLKKFYFDPNISFFEVE